MRGIATIALAATALLAALPLGCTRDRARSDAPFEGARPLDLACVKEGRAPTRPELETIVRAVVDAAGGEAALRKRTFRRLEDLYLQLSGDPESHHVRVTTWVRPDQTMRTLLEYKSGESEQRLLRRGEMYLSARGQPLSLALGANQQYVEWDWQLSQLPVWLLEASSLAPLPPSTGVDPATKRERKRVGMHVVVEGWSPAFDCWVDPAGPMVVVLEAILPMTGDLVAHTETRQRVEYSDFRRVDGLLYPFRRDISIGGKRFALADTREVVPAPALPDELFEPK
ncbi:MAG TPA: hypothetical protein VFG37_08375 [Planctomycetota bacterium]|jgi:hypothetical protein|nr:hypothetical protein [Planctomycetota bacterium]